MVTRKQVEDVLHKIHPQADLEYSFGDYWEAEIFSPPNHYWNEGPHTLVESVPSSLCPKPEFWQRVMDRLEGLEAVPCNDLDRPCEFTKHFGDCEYW